MLDYFYKQFISHPSLNYSFIDYSLYESTQSMAISLYLKGTITDVLIQDILIQEMITSRFIVYADMLSLYTFNLIIPACVIYRHLNYLFIDNKKDSSINNSTDTHSTSDDVLDIHMSPVVQATQGHLDNLNENSSNSVNNSILLNQQCTPPIPVAIPHDTINNNIDESMYDIAISNKNNSSQTNLHESVVNLSNRQLTPIEIKILQRGMKFCPTQGEPDISEIHDDLDKFHVRLKRVLTFL